MSHRFTPWFTPALERRQLVYISGPMTGLEDHNFPAFDEAATGLRALGYAVCSPAETSLFLGKLSHQQFLRFDFERILETDFMVVLPNWHASTGARAEILMALRMGIKCWEWATWAEHNLITESMVVDAIAAAQFGDL